MIVFLARECGWDKDYIAERLTVPQIRKYYELLSKQKLREIELNAIATLHAVATAFGTMEKKDFIEFLGKLSSRPIDPSKSIDDAKKIGLPVEEN
jgi:hypothetical protein